MRDINLPSAVSGFTGICHLFKGRWAATIAKRPVLCHAVKSVLSSTTTQEAQRAHQNTANQVSLFMYLFILGALVPCPRAQVQFADDIHSGGDCAAGKK
jgi:hypothetical protein